MKMLVMSDKLLEAKQLVQEVMDASPNLIGQLEQAISIIGSAEREIDDTIEAQIAFGGGDS